MADLTDEEKVQAALANEVEAPQEPAEPDREEQPTESAADDQPEETPVESTPESSFTKPQGYEWVRGDTLEEFTTNLQKAYENSTAEALKLRDQLKTQPAVPAENNQQTFDVSSIPEIQMLRAEQQTKMVDAFNEFAGKYPQAREPESFEKFQKASDGVAQAFMSANGRLATYPELFTGIAQVLGWQQADSRRDAAVKASGVSSGVSSGTTAAPAKPNQFSPKTIEIARRIPGNEKKSDAELVKELQEAVAA